MTITVLGATSDLAEALIYQLAGPEISFNLTARRPADLEPLRLDLLTRELCREVKTHPFDAQQIDFQLIEKLADETDLLIVAIGYLGSQPLAQENDDEARQILETNFTGPARAISAFAARLRITDYGLRIGQNPQSVIRNPQSGIIAISSVAGERGRASNYFYGAAKAGFSTFLDGLRHRLFASGIHVMTVKPGFLDTKMTAGLPLPKRLTASPEVAARHILRAWRKRRNTVFVLPVWRLIMLIIRSLPDFIFNRTKL